MSCQENMNIIVVYSCFLSGNGHLANALKMMVLDTARKEIMADHFQLRLGEHFFLQGKGRFDNKYKKH